MVGPLNPLHPLLLTNRMFLLGRCTEGLAHEVNSPLAAVTANISHVHISLDVEPLRRGGLREALDDAMTGATQVSHIINAFRSFARSDPLLGRPVDEVVEQARILVAHPCAAKAVALAQLHRGLDGPVPRVAGDAGVLLQALVNAMLFAADQMPASVAGAEVWARVLGAAPHESVRIEVSASGPAPAAAILEQPHTPDPTMASAWMARQLVEELAGTLTLHVRDDDHAFVIDLPAYGAQPFAEGPTAPSGERASILIIDDNQLVATSMSRMLAQQLDVRVVNNDVDALLHLTEEPPPDVVLCDLMMPGMTGEQLYEQAPAFLRSRFIFVTGGFPVGATRSFLEQHDVPCLEKPFRRSELWG